MDMDIDEMIDMIVAQERNNLKEYSKEDVLSIWANYSDPDDDEYDEVESLPIEEIIGVYLYDFRHGLEGNDEDELEDRYPEIFNWESYDKPNYKRMMTESVVQEPDWIPDGDGRAIGQQDFAINLSPLHAEEFRAYDDAISSRQEWMIKKLGGTPKKSMTRSDASDYIKELQGKESGTWSAETLAEIEGPTAEATTGGLHSPSSFTIGWEDGAGYSSASLPPNEIAWAEEVKGAETKIFGIGLGTLALGALGIFGVKKLMDSKKDDTASESDTKNAEKGCGCAKTVKKSVSVKESEYSVNQINPVEVEGQNDIHNAESVKLSSPYSGPQTAHRQNNRPARNLW